MAAPPLLAVPNFSEGRDRTTIEAIVGAAREQPGVRLLDIHADADHHRCVLTLTAAPGKLALALRAATAEAATRIDLRTPRGAHPHVGATDVVPLVYLDASTRGAACAEALLIADLLGTELDIPVLIYGELAGGRSRAEIRRGGLEALTQRMAAGELASDFGPPSPHPTAGVTLVGARPPLVAFNLQLKPPATLHTARTIAARIREGGPQGLPGLRAIGVELASQGGIAQVSMNVEDPIALPLAAVVEAVAAHAEIDHAELVGLAPRAALAGFPPDLEIAGFHPARQVIEQALGL